MSNRPKVTLEELLRLKRTERPEADFWANFERELRAKQLAALVRHPAWWSVSWAQVRAAMLRVVMPLGTAAVLGLMALNHAFVGISPAVPSLVSRPAAPAVAQTEVAVSAVVAVAGLAAQPAAVVDDAAPGVQPAVAEATFAAVTPAEGQPAPVVAPSVAFTTLRTGSPARATDDVSLDTATALPGFNTFAVEPAAPAGFASLLPEDNAAFAPLPAVRQLVGFSRPADGASQTTSAAETQARERVSRRLTENLLTSVSSRRMVDLEGSSVSVRF